MKRQYSAALLTVVGLVILGALLRVARDAGWVALPPNVAPITAMALFSGALLPHRLTFVVPLAAMLASDLIIGFYALPVMIAVYASFAISNLIGLQLRRGRSVVSLTVASLISSTIFFLVTNAAVWAFEAMYPHTSAGLLTAYTAGLPFFRNTILGDLAFTGLFFGCYQAVVLYWRHQQRQAIATTHG